MYSLLLSTHFTAAEPWWTNSLPQTEKHLNYPKMGLPKVMLCMWDYSNVYYFTNLGWCIVLDIYAVDKTLMHAPNK